MEIELGNLRFNTEYQLTFVGGLAFLFFYCYDSFNKPVKSGDSFVSTLAPRELASNQDYLKAFLVYFFLMTLIYAFLSIFFPHILQAVEFAGLGDISVGFAATPETDGNAEGLTEAFSFSGPEATYAAAWMPMAIAMILTGISTNYQWLNKIELSVRSATHRIIGIPDGIEKLAQRIQVALLDVEKFDTNDSLFIHEKFKLITGKELHDVSTYYDDVITADPLRRWIRMQFLFDRIENKKHLINSALNVHVFEHYDFILNRIRLSALELSNLERIKPVLAPADSDEQQNITERQIATTKKIDSTLHDIHAILAASIFQHNNDPASVMSAFQAVGLSTTTIRKDNIINGVIAAIFMLFFLVIVIVLLTPPIAAMLNITTSEAFPKDSNDALIWATSAISLHGASALIAWSYQNKRIVARRWRAMNIGKFEVPALQYAFACLVTYLAGAFALLCWWWIKQLFSGETLLLTQNELWIPIFGVLGMVTGFWVLYTIDVAQRSDLSKQRLLLQPLLHGLTTGLAGYFLMTVFLSGNPDLAFSVYVGIVTALQGGLIGTIVTLFSRHQFSKPGASAEPLVVAQPATMP
ncbi:hypothetical protein [Pelagibius sp. Alg239-R121]|uniref:hypothetical protein n=1 Tax=Pelagibius sp. Alg239-R121 TaxID=2993448 RepID=UPI0024A7585E|nr:hypothetical protein [Pelagibius sp. Alg239-R121]